MYSAQIRSSRTFLQKQILSSMKPRYLVSVFLISGLVSGCVSNGPGAFPRFFWEKKGAMYGIGDGVPRDYAEATKWIRKAADQGDADAKEWLEKNAKEKSE